MCHACILGRITGGVYSMNISRHTYGPNFVDWMKNRVTFKNLKLIFGNAYIYVYVPFFCIAHNLLRCPPGKFFTFY